MVFSRGRRWGVRELVQIYFKRKRTKGQNSIYCMLHLWKNITGYFFTFSLSDELYELSNFILKFQSKVYQSEVKSLSSGLLFVTSWTVFMDFLWPRGLPGFSVHGIFQARILEWVAISFSGRSSWLRDWTWVSRILGRRFIFRATREA